MTEMKWNDNERSNESNINGNEEMKWNNEENEMMAKIAINDNDEEMNSNDNEWCNKQWKIIMYWK